MKAKRFLQENCTLIMKNIMLAVALFMLTLFFLEKADTSTQVTTYGTLDNFDVMNDTGVETHGFEIELEGISSADVTYFFGTPYERYGDPKIIATSTGVIVRYEASYTGGSWSAGTPLASNMPPTDGHSCWTFGDPNYPNVGCDHFGISLNAQPTKTTYRWLIENQNAPGTLMVNGTNVPLPAPVWNVTPPADPAVNQPIAAAAISPLPSDNPDKCGEAMWVKVFTTELPNGLNQDDLEHMVVDDPAVDIVPDENDPAEVEWEWYLLQGCPGEAADADEFGGANEVGAGNEAVSRRFEFYKYAGVYDPDPEGINEAMCDNPIEASQQTPDRCGDPNAEGVAGVGEYIGKQNVAINLGGEFPVPNQPPTADDLSVIGDEDVSVAITLTAIDAEGDHLSYSVVGGPSHGVLSGTEPDLTYTPDLDYNGPDSFTYTANDGTADSNEAMVDITVRAVNDAPVLTAIGSKTINELSPLTFTASATDADLDTPAYALTGTVPIGAAINPSTGVFGWTPTEVQGPGSYTFDVEVSDGKLSDSETITVTVNEVNTAPTANAGPDQKSVAVRSTVTLDGSGSSDADGNALTYAWTLTTPAHSKAKLNDAAAIYPAFFADKKGTYTARLVVSDGTSSVSDTVVISITRLKKK